MPKRIKGKTLIATDEGDVVHGVVIKLYGEETNGAISIIEQPFEPGSNHRLDGTRRNSIFSSTRHEARLPD